MPEDPEEIPPLDEEWVQAAKHREESAEVRADRYARINSGFQQVQSGETSWRSTPTKAKSSGLSLARWVFAIGGILLANLMLLQRFVVVVSRDRPVLFVMVLVVL